MRTISKAEAAKARRHGYIHRKADGSWGLLAMCERTGATVLETVEIEGEEENR